MALTRGATSPQGMAAESTPALTRTAGFEAVTACLDQWDAAERLPAWRSGERARLHRDAERWCDRAWDGLEIGLLLACLGSEWSARHSVPAGAVHIDHLVIGPTGVFAVTANFRTARRQAAEASRRLSVAAGCVIEVVPVIVRMHAGRQVTSREAVGSAPAVVPSGDLVNWLSRPSRTSSITERDLVRLAAADPSTWSSVEGLDDPDAVRRFAHHPAAIRIS